MNFIRTIGLVSIVLMNNCFIPEAAHSKCNAICPKGYNSRCMESNGTCQCLCSKNGTSPKKQEAIFIKHIQAKEGVNKSQIENLDKILQEAVNKSSQNVDTPFDFTLKIQQPGSDKPKEVKYTITTSGQ